MEPIKEVDVAVTPTPVAKSTERPYEKPAYSIDTITYQLSMPGEIKSFSTDPEMPNFVRARKTSPNTVVWEFQDIWANLNEICKAKEKRISDCLEDADRV